MASLTSATVAVGRSANSLAARMAWAQGCGGLAGQRAPSARDRPQVASTFLNCQGSLSSMSSSNCAQRVAIGVQSV
jgi:hypothetical protein